MADSTLNTVLAGRYEKSRIVVSLTSGVARIAGKDMLITKNNVESVSPVNESTASTVSVGGAALGTLAFGTGGAALGKKTGSQYLLEIKWKTGETSLIKVDHKVYEAITVGMYKTITESEEQKIKSDDKSNAETSFWIAVAIGVVYAFFYMLNS
ncbi:hypothetical protein SAMN02910453_1396 [Lachnospiraceae bacterium A10]|nr:hypothetical protein SAMN02910453_1396 [Lachnospiraceae bacterium A10]